MIASLLHQGNSTELKSSHLEGEDTFRFAELGARVGVESGIGDFFGAFGNKEEGHLFKEIVVLML